MGFIQEESVPRPQSKRRTMLLPSNRVLLWKTEDPVKEKDKKKQSQTGLNMMFKFTYEDIPYIVKTQKAFELPLSVALSKACAEYIYPVNSKIIFQISVLMKKKVFKDKADTSENGISIKLDSQSEIDDTASISTLADNLEIETLLINEAEFRIVRNGIPISSVTLALTPIANQYCMPTIVFNKKKSVQSHWFVKTEKQKESSEKIAPTKKDVDSLYLSFSNEERREYSLEGYSFKHKGEYFSPDPTDSGRLVAVVVDTGVDNPVYAAISSRPINEPLEDVITDDQVKWCRVNKLNKDKDVVRIMCYNILADLYLNLNLEQNELFFNYCPKANQRVFYRTPIFLKQMKDFIDSQVSIFFLQEVDLRRHENYIDPFLKTLNYSSEISKKGGQISEGVAVVFDQTRYRTIYSDSFLLADLVEKEEVNSDIRRILESSAESETRFKTRPTIIQIVMLEDVETGVILVCGNTHLHHNPKDEHIKVLQALTCVRKLMKMFNEMKESEPERKCRLIFGGDFNSTPDGAVFQMMSNRFLPNDHKVWECDEKIDAEDILIEKKMSCLTGTPEYTNYTASSQKEGFVGCLDYIWGIDVESIRICPSPDHKKVIKYTALPSRISPSDHLPVICDIKL
ncbi:hypothetical protein CRE_04843 [Caenorhabditis remanei]|uniref:Uncharacterized protein n=1 Tax=Caenorhabditis remanei TaxID=31234 RepID=E3LYE4_CAERE|nr:hypothetical protein CRE_04843 [Caenorhabditis remanei]